jgi:hypothetical protein
MTAVGQRLEREQFGPPSFPEIFALTELANRAKANAKKGG